MPSQMILSLVESEEVSNAYGRFVAAPLEPGMGTTLGNALRRVLLSSLPGAAVTWVKIDGLSHEFSTVPHLKEDTIELLLNLKVLRLRPLVPQSGRLFLELEGQGVVTAADIGTSTEYEVVNPGLYLATMDSVEGKLSIELNVELGMGYLPTGQAEGLPVDALPVDAIFTPVKKVNYRVEQVHVSQDTSKDRLVMEVWTDATISPLDALSQGATLLSEQLVPFVETCRETPVLAPSKPGVDISPGQAAVSIEDMGFTVRTYNALVRGGIGTLGELVERNSRDLMELRQFGPKARAEVTERLQDMGYWKEMANGEPNWQDVMEAERDGEVVVEEAEGENETP
ncbi:MAG: DNA-directed RNA polymerase subunit alpha [Dehalococcoidia bacterium]|nr:DNA-directed RNA polymerase subunit alpha [Dehalococcoidia bacterium]MDP7469326.1 DNA-directed RNA polymerase subunit alpha [Dehalococcoidia bacterium]